MGDMKYNTEVDDYAAAPTLAFRGPPYGIVTDFILARGWARTRRQAEWRLLQITLVCIVIVTGLIFLGDGTVDPAPLMITPEEAAQSENP